MIVKVSIVLLSLSIVIPLIVYVFIKNVLNKYNTDSIQNPIDTAKIYDLACKHLNINMPEVKIKESKTILVYDEEADKKVCISNQWYGKKSISAIVVSLVQLFRYADMRKTKKSTYNTMVNAGHTIVTVTLLVIIICMLLDNYNLLIFPATVLSLIFICSFSSFSSNIKMSSDILKFCKSSDIFSKEEISDVNSVLAALVFSQTAYIADVIVDLLGFDIRKKSTN